MLLIVLTTNVSKPEFEPSDVQGAGGSAFYQHSGSVPLASRLSLQARRKMFRLLMDYFQPGPSTSILDVGVTSDSSFPESNYLEQMYPYPQNIVCVGTEDGSHLSKQYPGLQYFKVTAGAPLPFEDRRFDIVFSNAVIEHVGSRTSQADFARELCRVGRAFFVTTPDRRFPVEHHTGIPLLHYLPANLYRSVLGRTRYHYWAKEEHLNIVTKRSLAALFPPDCKPDVFVVRTLGFPSNLVAAGKR